MSALPGVEGVAACGQLPEGGCHLVWLDARRPGLVIPRHREINEHTAKGIIKKAEEVTTDGDE
jgi:hypothetical protein